MPDDGRSLLRRAPRSVRSVLPILGWLPSYRWGKDLAADLIAGIALAALLIPESMGYSGVAGVPTEVGLYAALGAVVAYAVTGGTSVLVVGPASAVAAMSGALVAEFPHDVDPVALTAALALMSGVLLVVAGALRLGWIVNFISRPVLEAFVAALSISIIIGQLDGLLGVEIEGESAVAKLLDVFTTIGEWDATTVVLGVGALVLIFALERFLPRIPAALVVVGLGIVLVSVFDLASEGVAVVGEIPQGLPEMAIPELQGVAWWELVGGGAALLLVGFSEGYAAVSATVKSTGEEVDADQELIGSGSANIASGLVGGLAVGGSISKSAASQAAGARTQMTNVVSGAVVLATLLFLGPIFENLPEPVLAAVVIAAVYRSADPRRLMDLRQVNRVDFAAALVTFALVLVWEALPAMIVGVLLSLAFLVRRASFPGVVEVRRGSDRAFRQVDTTDDPPLPRTDGAVVLRFEAPLLYANAERLVQAARALLADRSDVQRFVLDAEMLSDMDSTGAERLTELDDDLAERGVELHLARVHRHVREQIDRSHLASRFAGRMHHEIRDAVDAKSAE